MRLTLDIDDTSKDRVENITFNLKQMFPNSRGELYETKHGFHIIVYGTGLPFAKVIKLREKLGDDKRRILLDKELVKKPLNVLFSMKDGYQRKKIDEW